MALSITIDGGDLRQGTFLGTTNSEDAPRARAQLLSIFGTSTRKWSDD